MESLKEKVQDGLLEVNNEFITQPSNLRQAQVITLLACHNQPIAIKSRSSSQSAQEETLCGRPQAGYYLGQKSTMKSESGEKTLPSVPVKIKKQDRQHP